MADKEYTYSDVSAHATKKDLFIVVHDKVYNASSFVDEHPYVAIFLSLRRRVPELGFWHRGASRQPRGEVRRRGMGYEMDGCDGNCLRGTYFHDGTFKAMRNIRLIYLRTAAAKKSSSMSAVKTPPRPLKTSAIATRRARFWRACLLGS